MTGEDPELRLDAAMRAQYVAEVRDHLAAIDAAIGGPEDAVGSALTVYRHIHTVKGAASSMGDEAMSWFCHGLEDRLKALDPLKEAPPAVFEEVIRWRAGACRARLASVLWVSAGGEEYAIPSAQARLVHKIEDDRSPTPHLAACLEGGPIVPPVYAVELDDGESEKRPVHIGVDEVGRTEELLIRPLSPLVADIGPFSGAIVRGDGSLRRHRRVCARAARALSRVPETRASDRPLSWPPPAGAR